MSSANGKKLWALLAAGLLGATASSASAAPFITVSLLGSVDGGVTYSDNLVVAPGQNVNWKVQFQLAPQGTFNANSGPVAANDTISFWRSSDAATSASGAATISYALFQPAGASTQADFDSIGTHNDTWNDGAAYTTGGLQPRGDGNDDVIGTILQRAFGSFDGIGPANNQIEAPLDLASGVFDVVTAGAPTQLNIGIQGFATSQQLVGLRWRSATDATNVITGITVDQQNTSVANGDPLIQFNPLTIAAIPEPASLGLLALAGVGALGRRRRA